MRALALLDDLFFRSKIEAAAAPAGAAVVYSKGMDFPEGPWDLALVDLNLAAADPLAAIRRLHEAFPSLPIIGYCAHVQTGLQDQAREAGCAEVLPQSAFSRKLPVLLRPPFPASSSGPRPDAIERWTNSPGAAYTVHDHPYRKRLKVISGSIVFQLGPRRVDLVAGEQVEIPPNTAHSAVVGDDGVECVEEHWF